MIREWGASGEVWKTAKSVEAALSDPYDLLRLMTSALFVLPKSPVTSSHWQIVT